MLWAITSYFNPAGYRTKKHNYDLFRRHLGVPLLAVELAYEQRFELSAGDADCLIKINGDHVLWQKERLLNIGLSHLPEQCTAVAWIDADVVFENPNWPAQTLEALETHCFVQPFDEMLELECHQTLAEHNRLSTQRRSFASAYARGEVPADYLASCGKGAKYHLAPGRAWAGRRSILQQIGFYDAMILGSGDRAMVNAMLGEVESYIASHWLTPTHAAHYRNWAAGFYQLAQSKIGHIPGRLTHLWHGSLKDRNYHGRQEILIENEFDPAQDIECGTQQPWRWKNSSKPRLHHAVAEYFRDRREDG